MNATRRQYLRHIGAAGSLAVLGLAGCLDDEPAQSDGGGDPSTTDTDTPPGSGGSTDSGDDTGDTRPAGTGGPGVSFASIDDEPDLPVQPGVEIVREAATSESPPRLRTTLTNTSDGSVTVGEGRAVHFEYVTDDSNALVLLPGESDREWPAAPDCWRLTEGILVTEEYRTFEIEAGASSSRVVDLYATVDGDGCLPVGEYRFETTVSIVSSGDEPQSSADWGFSIVLE